MAEYLGYGDNPPTGYWDHGLVDELVQGVDNVVVVPARHQVNYIKDINRDLRKYEYCTVILTGDEESVFPWRELKHPHMRVWVMHPRIGKHDEAVKFPNGARPDTRSILKDLGMQERPHEWFFAGQVNNDRRLECVNILKSLNNGKLVETDGFGKGLEYPEYLKIMAQSKVVPCPSGIETPDTFRVYEALEAGCIPVVDAYSPTNPTPGFWNYLLGDPPFPILNRWSDFPTLLEELLRDWPHNANQVFSWWLLKKRELKLKLYGHA